VLAIEYGFKCGGTSIERRSLVVCNSTLASGIRTLSRRCFHRLLKVYFEHSCLRSEPQPGFMSTVPTMDHSEQQWSALCKRVHSMVPSEIGENAWYLIIVSFVSNLEPSEHALMTQPHQGRFIGSISRHRSPRVLLHSSHNS
jgi:hypothetical protein